VRSAAILVLHVKIKVVSVHRVFLPIKWQVMEINVRLPVKSLVKHVELVSTSV
jgi:hypothetical protein